VHGSFKVKLYHSGQWSNSLVHLQVVRPPYQVIREQYLTTHKEFTAVSEKFDEETNKHLVIMQVTNNRLTYLDLVRPVPAETLGDEVSLLNTVAGNYS